jgi:uncharacterized BrkB/YihY/UPF0761 family membrane protein
LTQLLGSKAFSDIMIADADGQFIFKENEFEDESFVAAAFVAKYRKVSSLESLKDQLMQYSNALKQQLYNIINRDYKDFITISTKVRKSAMGSACDAAALGFPSHQISFNNSWMVSTRARFCCKSRCLS